MLFLISVDQMRLFGSLPGSHGGVGIMQGAAPDEDVIISSASLPKLYQLLKPWHATILICAAVLKSSFSSYVPKRKGLLAILIVVQGALIHIYTFVSEISVRLQNFVCTPNLLLAF